MASTSDLLTQVYTRHAHLLHMQKMTLKHTSSLKNIWKIKSAQEKIFSSPAIQRLSLRFISYHFPLCDVYLMCFMCSFSLCFSKHCPNIILCYKFFMAAMFDILLMFFLSYFMPLSELL